VEPLLQLLLLLKLLVLLLPKPLEPLQLKPLVQVKLPPLEPLALLVSVPINNVVMHWPSPILKPEKVSCNSIQDVSKEDLTVWTTLVVRSVSTHQELVQITEIDQFATSLPPLAPLEPQDLPPQLLETPPLALLAPPLPKPLVLLLPEPLELLEHVPTNNVVMP